MNCPMMMSEQLSSHLGGKYTSTSYLSQNKVGMDKGF